MTREVSREEILKQLLETATKKWETNEVERIRPELQRLADSILSVEHFTLKPEQEPANTVTILKQLVSVTKKEGE